MCPGEPAEIKCLTDELEKMRVEGRSIELLREKDGVTVARVAAGARSYVLKYFHTPEFCREIANYRLLASLGVPTLAVAASTDRAILMEDIAASPYRLAEPEDLDSPRTAALIARWYRLLHQKGYRYLKENPGCSLYDENDVITLENLSEIKRRTGTVGLSVWGLLERNIETLVRTLNKARRTLTYNDFYYTNLAVAKDGASALMFDYNLLGKGYAYADIRNVCTSLSDDAKAAFLAEYGGFDESEVLLDEVACVLTTLHFACRRPNFPSWAEDSLEVLRTDLIEKVDKLLLTT